MRIAIRGRSREHCGGYGGFGGRRGSGLGGFDGLIVSYGNSVGLAAILQ